MSTQPKISVIIPVRNEEKHLGRVLEDLLEQSLPPGEYEVLVVDGMSEDRTREVVLSFQNRFPHLQVLDNAGILSGRARNVGARHAGTPYLLFLDGHCRILNRRMLGAALDAFRRGELCLSRPQPLAVKGVSEFQAAVALARQSFLGHFTGSKIFEDQDHHCNPLSAGCGYQKGLYFDVGEVDEDFDAAEDLEFNYRVHRMGIRAYHSQEFAVEYIGRDSPGALARQLFRYGYGRARMTRKHPGSFSPLPLLLGLAVVGALFLPLTGAFFPPALHLWMLGMTAYIALTGVAAAMKAATHSWGLFPRIWQCFPAIHLGAGLGYLSGLAKGPSLRAKAAEKRREPMAAL